MHGMIFYLHRGRAGEDQLECVVAACDAANADDIDHRVEPRAQLRIARPRASIVCAVLGIARGRMV